MNKHSAEISLHQKLAIAARQEPAVWTPECLEPEQLIGLIEEGTRFPNGLPLMAHVADCAYCRREWEEMEQTLALANGGRLTSAAKTDAKLSAPPESFSRPERDMQPPAWWRRLFPPLIGFSGGALAAASVTLMLTTNAMQRTETRQHDLLAQERAANARQMAQAQAQITAAQQATTQQRDLAQQSADRVRTLEKQIAARPVTPKIPDKPLLLARADVVSALDNALTTGHLALPDDALLALKSDARGKNVLPAPIELRRPISTLILEKRPILEAVAPQDVKDCQITVMQKTRDGLGRAIPTRFIGNGTGRRWQVTEDLPPDTQFEWWVSGTRNGEKPAQVASSIGHFQTLTLSAGKAVQQAQSDYNGHPLALGTLYAHLGLLDSAEDQLRTAQKAHPRQTLAATLLQDLQKQRQQTATALPAAAKPEQGERLRLDSGDPTEKPKPGE